jgi:biotin synthesis protein BioG
MNKLYLNSGNASTLIIVFLGWGFPLEAFQSLHSPGCHILLLCGYENYTPDQVDEIVKDDQHSSSCYKEVVVIGWSFGVKAAAMFIAETSLPISLRLAVNGTEYHIDDNRGIPKTIFDGTLNGLSPRTLQKFRLRCAGSKTTFDKLFNSLTSSGSNIEQLRHELEWFANLPAQPYASSHSLWDKVIIGENDKIFPAANQKNAWVGYDVFNLPNVEHVPDFQWIINNFVVDKSKVGVKFSSAENTYSDNAIVQRHVANKLYTKFLKEWHQTSRNQTSTIDRESLSILELGYGDGMFTSLYAKELLPHCRHLTLCDIQANPQVLKQFDGLDGSHCEISTVAQDVEAADVAKEYLKENSYDLIFSSSMFQWLNSPAMMLMKCSKALKPGGIMAISLYGSGTLREISSQIGNGLKYPSVAWMRKAATEAKLLVNSIEHGEEILKFATPRDAVRHLKLTGVNGLSASVSPAKLRSLLQQWPKDDEGRAALTFNPIYLILSKR